MVELSVHAKNFTASSLNQISSSVLIYLKLIK